MNKKVLVLIISSLFIVPIAGIIPAKGTDIWFLQWLALFSLCFVGSSIVLWQFNKSLAVFSLVCLYSAIFTAGQHPRALLCVFQVYLAMGGIYLVNRLSQSHRATIYRWAIALVVLQGFWIVLQSLNLDPIFNHINDIRLDDTVGFSGSHNQIGLFFAITAPIVLAYAPILIPLVIYGLWLSTTSFAWTGFAIGLIFYVSFKSRAVLIMVLTLILASTIVFYLNFEKLSEKAVTERIEIMKFSIQNVVTGNIMIEKGNLEIRCPNCQSLKGKAINQSTRQCFSCGFIFNNHRKEKHKFKKILVKCNPWFGYGLGNFIRISPHGQRHIINTGINEYGHRYEHVHNDFIEVFWEMGILGALSLLFVITDLIWKFIKTKKTKLLLISASCIVAHSVCALGIYTVHTAVSGLMLIISLGIFYGECFRGECNGKVT